MVRDVPPPDALTPLLPQTPFQLIREAPSLADAQPHPDLYLSTLRPLIIVIRAFLQVRDQPDQQQNQCGVNAKNKVIHCSLYASALRLADRRSLVSAFLILSLVSALTPGPDAPDASFDRLLWLMPDKSAAAVCDPASLISSAAMLLMFTIMPHLFVDEYMLAQKKDKKKG